MFVIGLALWLLVRTRLGTALSAIRMDEDAVRSMGLNPTKLKLFAFMLSAVVAGIGGALYVHYLGSIAPRGIFDVNFLFTILVAALIGGAQTIIGPIMGAYFLTFLLEYLRPFIPGTERYFIYGTIALVVYVLERAGSIRSSGDCVISLLGVRRRQTRDRTPPGRQPDKDVRRRLTAVNKMSFEVEEGESLGLIGSNGAGKTTIFSLIMGELRQNAGTIRFDGEDISRAPTHQRAKRGIVRTYQVPRPFGEMSVQENIRVGMMPDSIPQLITEPPDVETERAIGTSVGFGEREIAMLPGELSMGDLRRLELARTIATGPKLLMLDEVFAGLTYGEIGQISELLAEKRKDGLTYIIVSHDLRALKTPGRPGAGHVLRRASCRRFVRRDPRRQGSPESLSGALTMALLEIADVEAFYGKARSLRGVSLEVEAGSIVAIIGPNGAASRRCSIPSLG